MTTGRLAWIVLCLFWTVFWFLMGFFTFFVTWILALASLIAVFLPVGTVNKCTHQKFEQVWIKPWKHGQIWYCTRCGTTRFVKTPINRRQSLTK